MSIAYEGVLIFPTSYQVMDTIEMTYVEGGASLSSYDTAQNNSYLIAGLISLATTGFAGYAVTAAAGAPSIFLGVLGLGGMAYFTAAVGFYTKAYNQAQSIISNYGKSRWTRFTQYSLGPIPTGAECVLA